MTSKKEIKPSVLLVDDHPSNLFTLEAVLGTAEYRLITATSGAEALSILEREEIALVLLDVQMPGMDGYEVLRRIKSGEQTKHIPVILVTAIYTEDPHVKKGYEVGAIDYFSKPFNPELLRLKVGIYAELYTRNLMLRRQEEERRAMESRLRTLEDRERDRKKIEDRRSAELRTILESIPDAVYVGDESGITRCNSAALSLFGFDTREEFNQHFERLADRIHMRYSDTGNAIPPGDLPYSHALRGEQFVCELKIRQLSSGKDVTIACAASPVVLEGQIIGAVVVNVNVTNAESSHLAHKGQLPLNPVTLADGRSQ